jgi:hypothetical protein
MDSIISITDTLRHLRTSGPRSSDDEELFASLAANRIRRTGTVCLNVVADLDAGTSSRTPRPRKNSQEQFSSYSNASSSTASLPRTASPWRLKGTWLCFLSPSNVMLCPNRLEKEIHASCVLEVA